MKKKERKGAALPIDWDTSQQDSRVLQTPKRATKDLPTGSKGRRDGAIPCAQPGRQKAETCRDHMESDEPSTFQMSNEIHGPGWKKASQWRPDVFVRAFVPDSLAAINRSVATTINSPAIEGVDFGQYISTFAGSRFLSPVKLSSTSGDLILNRKPLRASLGHLKSGNYAEYFGDCLALDQEARISLIRSYDLFGAVLEVRDSMQSVYSLRVPGLREDTPSVGLGDSIMLRQLVLDPATKLPYGMNEWLAPGGGIERGEQAPGFTGYHLNAVVSGVDRANEVLLIRAHGVLTAGFIVCNVSFTVQARLLQSVRRVVVDIANELNPKDRPSTTPNLGRKSASDSAGKHFGQVSISMGHPMTNLEVDGREQGPTTLANRSNHEISGPCDEFNQLGTGVSSTWLHSVLFPQESDGVQQHTLPSAVFPQKWIDTSLNYEQKKAVDTVQSNNYGNVCYLINGPPGTGKTKTLCELVTQLAQSSDFAGSILLCAPSNPAADTLALRLRAHFKPGVLLRLHHFSRTFAEVPQELLPYCYVENDLFNIPPMTILMSHKIVVTTCQDADILVQARLTNRDLSSLQVSLSQSINPRQTQIQFPLHWTALVVDEAAQATEPETLIPLSVLSPPTSSVSDPPILIMAGDQHQLNPRTYNISTNLHMSLFERLSAAPVYASHPLARRSLGRTKYQLPMLRPPFSNLIRNYRSHPAILAVPSSLFYENTLIPEASHIHGLEAWSGWRGRRWPVMFACNAGIDVCEDIRGVGGRWYNVREAQKAVSFAEDLVKQSLVTQQSEICIMSPFQAQVTLLRKLARRSQLWGVNIGPMEAFQGLESRFVIICTTRARERFLEDDKAKGLGIVDEKKKFNVAITRAKEGLIVLGNPWVLATDPHWLAFLEFCARNGLWQEDDDDKLSMYNLPGVHVNQWRPLNNSCTTNGHRLTEISGLEAALVYKERDKEAGSKATKRFIAGNESAEDALWRSGIEAEHALGFDDFETEDASQVLH